MIRSKFRFSMTMRTRRRGGRGDSEPSEGIPTVGAAADDGGDIGPRVAGPVHEAAATTRIEAIVVTERTRARRTITRYAARRRRRSEVGWGSVAFTRAAVDPPRRRR